MIEKTAAEIIVDYLKAKEIKYIFGVAGMAIVEILDALARTPEIRYIPTQHEQAASLMADGYARATGEPGVCLAIGGPGATNLLTGVAQAYLDSSPVITIVGERSTREYGKGVAVLHDADLVSIFKPVTKLSVRLERADRTRELLEKAFRVATQGRKGPVYVGVPLDVQQDKVSIQFAAATSSRECGVSKGDPGQIAKAAQLLLGADNPAILVGGGVLWSRAESEVIELAELLSIPIAVSYHHKGAIPDDHPLCVGFVSANSHSPGTSIVSEADVILAIGCTFDVFTTGLRRAVISERSKIIQIDIDPIEIGQNYPVEVGIVGDAKSILRDLLDSMRVPRKSRNQSKAKDIQKLKEQWEAAHSKDANSEEVPIKRLRLLRDVRAALDRNAMVTEEGAWFLHGFKAYTPFMYPGAYLALGSPYPMALAIKLAMPERQVVCLLGDGAFMMVMQELATAVAQDIPVVAVIANNGAYGNVKKHQLSVYKRALGTDLCVPNLAEVAKAFGAYGERVERPEEIIPAMRRALASGKPAVLDVIVSSSFDELAPG